MNEPIGVRLTDIQLNEADRRWVTSRSDMRSAWIVFCQWGITIAIFAVAALWPNPLTIIGGTILLGGRLLGFFVLTHECGHRSLFRSAKVNAWVSDWIMSPMDFTNGRAYIREHLAHHRSAGTADDPDLRNYQDYPITVERLRRKLMRDITGRTGWRNLAANLSMLVRLNQQDSETRLALIRGVIMNLLILGVMSFSGAPWLYLMWIAALIFVQPVVVRIRQIAEHAAVPDLASSDPRLNTRTTYANPLTRLLLCPHQVNYHIEHHLLASVPIYNLRKLHSLLLQRGHLDGLHFPRGYLAVLSEVTKPAQAAA